MKKQITIEEMIFELGEPNFCECRCGEKIHIDIKYYTLYKRIGYPKFLRGHSSRGKPKSQITKDKISKTKKERDCKPNSTSFKKGQTSWCKGLTKETDYRVKNIAEKLEGREISSETKEKQRQAKLGIPLSEIHKQHLKENHWDNSGKNHYNYGKHLSQQQKEKIRQSSLNIPKSEQHKIKIGLGNKGKKRTEEQNVKTSKVIKEYYRLHPEARNEISERQIGRTLSIETIEKIKKNALRGDEHPKPWLGKNLSQDHKNKIKENLPDIHGDKHPNWKGGITLLKTQIWNSDEYNIWRTSVFIRDNRKCKKCESIENIEAHHIKSYQKIIKDNNITSLEQALSCSELWNINNGVTLCHRCHTMTDSYKKKIK